MNQPLNSNVIISDMHINIFIYHIASGYSVQGPISVRHQFSCPAVISVIIISVNSFNNKLQVPLLSYPAHTLAFEAESYTIAV